MSTKHEDKLHRSIWQQLKTLLPDDCEAWSVENRNLGPVAGRLNKLRGCKPGVPDIHFLYRGKLLCVELKYGRTQLSPHQKEMHARIRHCGGAVCVCRSLEDVAAFLTENGVRIKGTVQ